MSVNVFEMTLEFTLHNKLFNTHTRELVENMLAVVMQKWERDSPITNNLNV